MLNEEIEEDDSLNVDLEESQEVEQDEVIEKEADNIEETDDSEEQEEETEDLVVTIGDAEPEPEKEPAPAWVKELRKQNRELKKQLKAKEQQPTEKKPVKLGEKPTLESCDYDSNVYEQSLVKWFDDKKVVEQQEIEAEQEKKTQTEQWKKKQQKYADLKDELKVKNFDDAEDVVKEKLGVNEQGIILHTTKNPALVVYALSKNKKKLEEMASIKDPIVFAYKLAELEGQLKVSGRKAKPAPEKTINSSGGASLQSDKALDRLFEQCSKKGDMTEYYQAKRARRKK